MNVQAIQQKLNNYMKTATPEQIVKEFEDLGVESVRIKFIFETTFAHQIELLPRLTILYGRQKGIAIEWLWFSLYYGQLNTTITTNS